VNSGTNGVLSKQAPAGRAARPGLAVGAADAGFFAPSATSLAASVGGTEVLRATAAGGFTFGGSPGSHAFEVAAPAAAVNRVLVNGAAAGAPVSVQAQGADASIGLALTPRGAGALSAQVASGAQSVVGGGTGNTASGLGAAVAGGAANAASGSYSWAPGGSNSDARRPRQGRLGVRPLRRERRCPGRRGGAAPPDHGRHTRSAHR
jgi:hypothetical protein